MSQRFLAYKEQLFCLSLGSSIYSSDIRIPVEVVYLGGDSRELCQGSSGKVSQVREVSHLASSLPPWVTRAAAGELKESE